MFFKQIFHEFMSTDFADLEIQYIGVWPKSVRYILIVCLLFFILVLGYFLQVKDIDEQYLQAKIMELELLEEYLSKTIDAANLDIYEQQVLELDGTFGALLKRLPKNAEVPGLLEDISAVAFASGLNINAISLQPEKALDVYIELPISIDVIGDYHGFGDFVSGVAALSRIVTLHDYSIKQVEGGRLNLVITARTYRYQIEGFE
ncbi:MAG: type IV pilus assembly protein PilO [Porticoccaceae bacterium]|jgi:type IV pilus assembly protein PilO|tara:strand:+ start:973 stop:1584 length:612 start_codon:yes stop_codon:yes gene_type:complete